MPGNSLSLPASAKVKQVKSIPKLLSALHCALCKFWLLIYQFPEQEKTTKVNYEVCISLIILKANMKASDFDLGSSFVFCAYIHWRTVALPPTIVQKIWGDKDF